MKALAISVTADRATVLLQPCWLARLFGDDDHTVELEWVPRHANRPAYDTTFEWRTVATKRWIRELDRELYHLIQDALDFRPRGRLPAATARERLAARSGE